MIKPIAAVLIVALLVVGIIASCFIASDKKLVIESNFKLEIIKDHEPAPTIHYHITKEGVWAA